MLNDGRLRGFKVGGQWRFSRPEIESWLQERQRNQATAEAPASSATQGGVLPVTCVQAIQVVCAEALGIAVVTTEPDGTPLAGISNSCGFCNWILSTEAGRRRCAESWTRQPDGKVEPCHAGLLGASLPIVVAGQPVALVAACQFITEDSDGAGPAWRPNLAELAASLGLAEAELRAAAGNVRVMSEDDLRRVSRLLRRAADTFAEIGQERLNLIGRLEKIAEMSRI